MAYEPPEIEVIINRLKTYVKEVLRDLNPTDQNCFIYSLLVAMANLSNDNNLQLKLDIIPNSFVNTCKNEEALEPFAKIKNISRNTAEISKGNAVIVGLSGSVIPLGSIFVANNIKYRLANTVEIAKQSININKISCNGTIVTVETSSNHNFASNITVTIEGCATEKFNGDYVITATGLNTFTYNIESDEPIIALEDNIGTASATIGVLTLSSQTTGKDTNLNNGDALAIETAIAGVGSNAYTMYSGISGGTNEEDFASWKERVEYRYQNPITYFNEANIITTAKTVEGVTRVWVKSCTPEVGQVTIYFVRDNDANIIPDANEIAEVKQKIVGLRTAKDSADDIFVYAPTEKIINFKFSEISPNTSTMKTAITNSLKQLFDEEIDLGKNLTLDKIKSYIQNSFDMETGKKLDTFVLNIPNADIECADNELATLGSITFE